MQILRVVPYSATQLYSYEVFKRAFAGRDGKLSVPARLGAGACAGMTATLARPRSQPSLRASGACTRSLMNVLTLTSYQAVLALASLLLVLKPVRHCCRFCLFSLEQWAYHMQLWYQMPTLVAYA